MKNVIDTLYKTFASYRIGNDFFGCECCVSTTACEKLGKTALRDLTIVDLEMYSRKAMSTWGNERHFKHFLPRIFELTIAHRNDFLDLAVVFGKLALAHWDAWPKVERQAIHAFFEAYFQFQLEQPILGTFDDSMDTVLCAIAAAEPSIQFLLDTWLLTSTCNAKRHLASFILNNEADLLKKAKLSNAFWNVSGIPHEEVLKWLQSNELYRYLDGANYEVDSDDFNYAWPQLMAIRAALSN